MKLLHKIKELLPAAMSDATRAMTSHEESFDEIYKKNLWGFKGGGSGPGSELGDIWPTVILLSRFISENHISHVVDLSCGAMNWWPTALALSGHDVRFTGLDVSKKVISRNRKRLASFSNMEFRAANALTAEIPSCDLLVCRETLNHLPIDDARTIIGRMAQAPARFFALSQNRYIKTNLTDGGREVKIGTSFKYTDWNLALEPFNLGDPIAEIPEKRGRSLAIYELG